MAATWLSKLEGGPPRVNHISLLVGHSIYTLGGYHKKLEMDSEDEIDIHIFNIGTYQWRKFPPTGSPEAPYMRFGHAAVLYGSKIILWGGRNENAACNQLFMFDCVHERWSRVETTGAVPEARDGHTACIIDDKMYIFGGFVDEPFLVFATGTHALDLTTMVWERLETKGEEPTCRDFHAVAAVGTNMYLFGGRRTKTPPFNLNHCSYPNTMHVFDTVSSQWHKFPKSPDAPVGRRSHSMFVHGTDIYIFGGFNALRNEHFNDLHRFDTMTRKWHPVPTHGDPPCPRRRQTCVPSAGRVYVYGGTSPKLLPNDYLPEGDEFEDSDLDDNGDTHVLELSIRLTTLCINYIIKNNLAVLNVPRHLENDIRLARLKETTIETISHFKSYDTRG